MARSKEYASADFYEKKLAKVMERFGVTEYDYNFDRKETWVQFRYKSQLYRFEHSVERARESGKDISYGSDAFAMVVLALQDLVRMIEYGIYDLSTWIAGMRYLPPPVELPQCFRLLGFSEMPGSASEVKQRYRSLAKKFHPDARGGVEGEDFSIIQDAAAAAVAYFE